MQKAIKGSVLVEYLAHNPVMDYQPMRHDFLDEDIFSLTNEKLDLMVRWAYNISPRTVFPFYGKVGFSYTNNMAEYEACAMGVSMTLEYQVKSLKVNIGMVNWIHPRRKRLYCTETVSVNPGGSTEYDSAWGGSRHQRSRYVGNLRWIRRVFKTKIRVRGRLHATVKRHLACLPSCTSYMPAIWSVVDSSEADYRSDMTLLRCVDDKEAKEILEEIHEGIFGTHPNGPNMARKILRAGYYRAKMESNCCKHVSKCHKCQIYADNIRIPPTPLNVLSAPWPFSMWGIDVIGPIEPKASNGHRFILVAIDYFIKWVEAASYPNVTKNVVIKFVKKISFAGMVCQVE
ncbi:Gypsy retrotransposon integrase-like protein 1, partial [Mucuna pruriens]